MATITQIGLPADSDAREMRKVILGASLGTIFEWYDFFIYGTLAAILGPLFFPKELGDTGAFLAGIATYLAGLAIRPLGALVFGRLGDVVGRKYTFLVTIIIMGIGTACVGLLPTYATAGVIAPILLVTLRCVQGLAMGGEYGGAATYVAEHSEPGKRGLATGWIQMTATVGFFISLLVVMACEAAIGSNEFKTWGWRIPFIFSILLLVISVYIRSRLEESPVFLQMKAEGRSSKAPVSESLKSWPNVKLMLLALFGIIGGTGIVWYTAQFYALIFMQKSLKIELQTSYIIISAGLMIATPFFLVFGRLSDRVGRKKIAMAAMVLAIVTYIPIYKAMMHFGNPALEAAIAKAPVVVSSNECGVRFFAGPSNDCERVKEFLTTIGVPHSLVASAENGVTTSVAERSIRGHDEAGLKNALKAAGYPEKANPVDVNKPMLILLVACLMMYVCMSYGVLAAYLVELFPARIRYTSLSLPYHIGLGYFGAFMLYFSTLISANTGDVFAGLYYPIGIALVSLLVGVPFLPETKDRDITV
jgi:MFS family permease